MGEQTDRGSDSSGRIGSERVGVLTFHRCINYGSYWQARCLVEGLRGLGYDSVLLDHRSAKVDVAEWRCALQPKLPVKETRQEREQYGCKARKFQEEIERLPLSAPFPIDQPEHMEEVDTVLIGSDEVWNLRHAWYREKPIFFGQGLRTKRVVAHAASFGNYSSWEGLGTPWTDFLRRIDAISVRDENSWWILKNNVGLEPDLVLDPCLQFPLPAEGGWNGPSHRPFALVYGHSFTEGFAAKVRAWAKERGLALLSLGYGNEWADMQWLTAGPQDFAHAFERAEAVVTDFFHGCVFALQNDKPFACELADYRSIKVRGLMELLESESHIVREDTDVRPLLESPISNAIKSRIAQVRSVSDAYLRRALEGSHATHAA
jgi:hypothetical protein